jgi:mRNA interferase RelE/StbE
MTTTEPHWEIVLSRQARKVMQRIPGNLLVRIDQAIQALATNPRPSGCKKLTGTGWDNLYRIRVGDWRISYAIEEDRLIILIVEVSSRGDAYRF